MASLRVKGRKRSGPKRAVKKTPAPKKLSPARKPLGLVPDVASGATITLRGTGKYRITGTSIIETILGVRDGDEIILLPEAAFGLNALGNINPLTTTATIDRPVELVVMNGVCYEVGPSTGGGDGGSDGLNRIAAGTQTAGTLATVVFSNSNNVSFGMSGSTRVTASASFPAQTVQPAVTAIGVSGGNTAGDTGTTQGTYYLQGGNNITLSQVTAAGSVATLVVSGPAGGGGADGVNILAAGTQTANTTGTVAFIDSNGISFGMSNSSRITASYTVPSQSVQPGIQSVSAGTTRVTTGEAVFSNSNGISFGANGQTITAQHNALTSQSNQALSGSNGSFTFQTATFGNLNGMSFYTSNGSLVGSYTVPSVPAQTVESQSIGMNTSTAGGGTGGTSGYASGGQVRFDFYAGSNITLSQSVNAASGSLTIFGTSGGGGGGAAPTVSFFQNAAPANTGNSQLPNATLVIWPLNVADIFPGNMTASTMFLNMTGTVSTGASWRRSISLGFYTLVNSTQLSLCFSASTSFGSSATNTAMNQSFAGYRWLTLHSSQFNIQPTFSQTKYWFALWDRSTSGSQSFSFHGQSHFVHTSVRSGFINAASNSATTQGWHPFNGNYSVSFSTAMPDSLAASAINKTGATAVANFIPNIILNNVGSNIV